MELQRRQFLLLSGFTGLAIGLPGLSAAAGVEVSGPEGRVAINHYVQIRTDGKIVIFAPNPEVGQGVRTSLPMIVAEELDADWGQVIVKNAEIDQEKYGIQAAGGSTSVLRRWPELRKMGAVARQMLLGAAAEQLKVPITELATSRSRVLHAASGRQLPYADLAERAARMPLPDDSALKYKQPADYSLIGKRIGNVDNRAIVTGEPLFGSDTRLPGMLYATFVKCPAIGGRPRSANLDQVKAQPGVVAAFIVEGTRDIPVYDPVSDFVSPGVAIVARSTWQALKARQTLEIDWDLGSASRDNSADITKQATKLARQAGAKILVEQGDVDAAFAASDRVVEGFYSADFAAHAPLEPQNCVAHVTDDAIEVWAPTQTPTATVAGVAKLMGLPTDKVTVHQIRGGGGFGRRLENDYAREAALIAGKVSAPVMLQWTREDEMAFDYFRPPAYDALKAALDDRGRLTAWQHHVIAVSDNDGTANKSAGYRATAFPRRRIEHFRVASSFVPSQTPTGPMRAPVSNTYAFAEQSFVHELALAAKRDHLEFLLEMLGEPEWLEPGNPRVIHTGRAVDTIRQVAQNAGWGRSMPEGRALGLSFFFSHATPVAEIAEVSVDAAKNVSVHDAWVVADCGPVINLSGAEGQCQGSVIDGISTMARQSISIEEGRVRQTNFHQYPLLRADQQPRIHVQFLQSDFAPTGMGEPALPPIAAAVCNAIYSITGHRIRRLPISAEGFTIG
jgi:isoquinoline 1-oxidoreductase beta subunit